MATQYADNINLLNCTPEEYGQKLEILKKYCSKNRRNFNDIKKSWHGQIIIAERERSKKLALRFKQESSIMNEQERSFKDLNKIILGTPEDCIESIQRYINFGAEYFIFNFPFSDGLEAQRIFMKKIVPAFK